MTVEAEVANRIVRQQEVAHILARTGGEIIHPDHYDIREEMRLAVLHALDAVCAERGLRNMSDAELPALFRAIDPIAQRVFHKSVGL